MGKERKMKMIRANFILPICMILLFSFLSSISYSTTPDEVLDVLQSKIDRLSEGLEFNCRMEKWVLPIQLDQDEYESEIEQLTERRLERYIDAKAARGDMELTDDQVNELDQTLNNFMNLIHQVWFTPRTMVGEMSFLLQPNGNFIQRFSGTTGLSAKIAHTVVAQFDECRVDYILECKDEDQPFEIRPEKILDGQALIYYGSPGWSPPALDTLAVGTYRALQWADVLRFRDQMEFTISTPSGNEIILDAIKQEKKKVPLSKARLIMTKETYTPKEFMTFSDDGSVCNHIKYLEYFDNQEVEFPEHYWVFLAQEREDGRLYNAKEAELFVISLKTGFHVSTDFSVPLHQGTRQIVSQFQGNRNRIPLGSGYLMHDYSFEKDSKWSDLSQAICEQK
jgi:hypothetical protein